MIQANELRIGNWVINSHNEYQQVFKISDEAMKVHKKCTKVVNCKPIPLTPEILEKCGFVKDNNDYEYDHEDFCSWYEKDFPIIGTLMTSSDGSYLFDEETNTLRIKYLHQLQNLFYWLSGGEELNPQL